MNQDLETQNTTPDTEVDTSGVAEHEADDDELSALAVDDGKGNKVVPLSALVGVKKQNRELSKKVKELEPVASRVTEIEQRLERAAPVINAVLTDPALAAAVQRKTNPSAAKTEQPADDPDATEYADAMGWYTETGAVDVARAQRAIKIQEKIAERTSQKTVAPFANLSVGSAAERNITQAIGMTDNSGVPLATEESIREVAGTLPAHLLANPDVMDLVLNNAIGLDRRKGRTPKAVEEPLLLDSVSGRPRGLSVIDADTKRRINKLGLTEKDYQDTMKRMESAGTRGVRLE